MSVYDEDNFSGRVAHAAATMLRGGSPTRRFDTCFEMHDGDLVAVALYRRAETNPKLAAALPRYLSPELREPTIAKYRHVPTRHLADAARKARAQARESFTAFMAERHAQT